MSEKYDKYLKSPYWAAVTVEVKRRAGYKCQVCNSPHDLQAHHRTYEHRGSEMEHLADLICMCRRCHGIFHGKIEVPFAPKVEVVRIIEKPLSVKHAKRDGRRSERSIPQTEAMIEADMPPNTGTIILTRDLIDRTRTNGAFTNETMRGLGFTEVPEQGWTFRLRGTEISADSYRKALAGRFQYSTGKLPRAQYKRQSVAQE